MSADPWPIRRLLAWTESFFRDKGIESPRLEAQILLSHVLDCKKIDLYVRSDEEPTEPQRTAFKALIKKRVEGCPVAYLVGQREFYRLNFEVTPAVLIPRPETEFLVVESLRFLKGKSSPRVVDIGTGSGCIALSIAQQHPSAQITAIDLSPKALAVARVNAEKHSLSGRVRFVEGDLFSTLGNEKFDLVVSNPPYVSDSELAELARDVKDFEPRLALAGGPDGLAVYRRLIAAAPAHLPAGGQMLLEIGATQEHEVKAIIAQTGCFEPAAVRLDAQKLPRVILAQRE